MTDFHRTSVNGRSFIRGAARMLVAPYATQTRPTKIGDVVYLASGMASGNLIYDAKPGWIELGATKTGCQITINNTEESFDVDQILADISSAPTNWECSVGTQLAEFTPEKMQIAWEASATTVDTAIGPNMPIPEQEIGVGNPDSYTERRLAVLFQRPSGLIRAYLFHKVQRTPQESSITHAKTGEQISIPTRFKVLAEPLISDPRKRFFIVRDQDVNPALLV